MTEDELKKLLRTVVSFHDLGKPVSHEHQHRTTTILLTSLLDHLHYNKKQIEFALALIDQDILGNYLKSDPILATNKGQ